MWCLVLADKQRSQKPLDGFSHNFSLCFTLVQGKISFYIGIVYVKFQDSASFLSSHEKIRNESTDYVQVDCVDYENCSDLQTTSEARVSEKLNLLVSG